MSVQPQRGFTLLEMIVAMALFAALSLAATQAIYSLVNSHQRLQSRSQERLQCQAAVNLIEQDITQAVLRQPLDTSQLNLADFRVVKGESDELELVTLHQGPPSTVLPRPVLQRVKYRLNGGALQRIRYPSADASASQAKNVTLIAGVNAFRLRFWLNGRWQAGWFAGSQLPRAIEVSLDLATFGEVRRVILLNRVADEKE